MMRAALGLIVGELDNDLRVCGSCQEASDNYERSREP